NEDEDDEVFVGPVGHKEKCVSVNIEMQAEVLSEPHTKSPVEQLINWSPLTGDKFVEIFKEAHLLVKQFEKITDNSDEASKENIPIRNKNAEQFVEDSDSKLNVFQNVKGTVVSPIKRETFCVQDSPFRILPPAVQQHLKISTGTSSPLKMHNGTVSPSRKNMRCSLTKKSKKDPSFSYTKQILPSKMIPLKIGLKSTALKVPSLQRRSTGVVGRKSSSSSSSVSSVNSSMNSSLSISPLGKTTGAKVSSSHIKSTAVSKVVKSASASKLNSPMRKQGAIIPHTPLEKGLQRLSSVPNFSCSSQKSKAGSTAKIDVCKKPKALVAPTPTGQRKLPGQSESMFLFCLLLCCIKSICIKCGCFSLGECCKCLCKPAVVFWAGRTPEMPLSCHWLLHN
uniref:G2 and S phase-expressed protein 1 N-terminal domain-containing protein n=1 Tax=Erpetoichthys calabaricus TaxID=27687 RepID=A0A8C4RVI3_ERPCA